MPPCHGVDTSNNQGAAVVGIGPQLVELGVEGWWHKATQSDTFRDRYWPACRQARIDNGLRYGGPYHWLQPHHDVGSQFRWFEAYVGDLKAGECIQLDIEDPGGLSDDVVFEAIDRWEGRWPDRVLVYAGRWYMPYNPTGKRVESYLIDRLIARYGSELKWWLPWYSSTYPAAHLPTTPVMWQWAGGAGGVLVQGVGRIDSNQIIDRARLELLSGYGEHLDPDQQPVPQPQPSEDDMTPDERAALFNIQHLLEDVDPGHGVSVYYAALETHAQVVRTDQLVDRIAAAVVAALPPAQAGSLTAADVADEIHRRLAG